MDEFMADTPEQAKNDSWITQVDYHVGWFREYFTTPYQQFRQHVGKYFTVLKQIRIYDEDEDDMYLIQFEDGTKIEAFGHEVCLLDYKNCA